MGCWYPCISGGVTACSYCSSTPAVVPVTFSGITNDPARQPGPNYASYLNTTHNRGAVVTACLWGGVIDTTYYIHVQMLSTGRWSVVLSVGAAGIPKPEQVIEWRGNAVPPARDCTATDTTMSVYSNNLYNTSAGFIIVSSASCQVN